MATMATLKLNAMKYVFDKVDVAPCFILFYQLRQKTNKQTNRKNVCRDTATVVANYSGPDTNKNKNKNKKY